MMKRQNETNAHAVRNGYWKPHIGSNHGRAKLTESDIPKIRRLQGKKLAKEIAAKYGVSDAAIRLIWSRQNWKHVK